MGQGEEATRDVDDHRIQFHGVDDHPAFRLQHQPGPGTAAEAEHEGPAKRAPVGAQGGADGSNADVFENDAPGLSGINGALIGAVFTAKTQQHQTVFFDDDDVAKGAWLSQQDSATGDGAFEVDGRSHQRRQLGRGSGGVAHVDNSSLRASMSPSSRPVELFCRRVSRGPPCSGALSSSQAWAQAA